ncbi:uncharacterized protein LOC128293774 [Gossypium arboreum]|uniref:uncharacterized protein LOC128293774 n=1 Tax=Gossypium arboreum TaxID=29729 RepID=UPI0022F1A8EA|nr:uncharacterized protein LOC128293774 [Gossypium arboreum]
MDQKRKEFLELKQGRMTVTQYGREFVRLSKYARECVSTEAIMYKRFEDGLNEYIQMFVGMLELKEFVVLVERACTARELAKEKRKAKSKARDSRKRPMSKSFQSTSKKFRDFNSRSHDFVGFPNRNKDKHYLGTKAQTTSIATMVGNGRPSRLECPHCSPDHFIRECPKMTENERYQSARSSNTAGHGRPQKNLGNRASSKSAPKESTVRPKGRAPARTYAIRAREKASSLNVIIGTFSIYDTTVIVLIDLGSTHSYICMKLVSSMSMLVEPTKFMIKVSNPLGKCVLVDKVCRNFLLMIRGHCFPANLMLLPFDEM